jgi:hypothetical protein
MGETRRNRSLSFNGVSTLVTRASRDSMDGGSVYSEKQRNFSNARQEVGVRDPA